MKKKIIITISILVVASILVIACLNLNKDTNTQDTSSKKQTTNISKK